MARATTINPEMLVWAREAAGLSAAEAADRIGLSTSARATAEQKLEALESGETSPTRNQLLKIASVYHRPLTTFYLQSPPRAADRGEDYRTFDAPVEQHDAANLDALVRDIRARQATISELIAEEETGHRLDFVGSLSVESPVRHAVRLVSVQLDIEDDRALRKGMNAPKDLFDELRRRVEALGVFVILAGNLGTHHTNISERVFRGFAVADPYAPMIVINDGDARAAWAFTLLHELVHILTGSTGISGAPTTVADGTSKARVERFCNDVAGRILLPDSALAGIDRMTETSAALEVAANIADIWKVSEGMVAYRMWRTDRLDTATYQSVHAAYGARWRQFRDSEKAKARNSAGGPSYYVVRRHRVGDAMLQFVGRSLRSDVITHTKAAKLLGVRPTGVEPMLAGMRSLGSA
ncbi:ImmA/IrrE family metallo-endopeptidase [Roseivivax sp. GX 12232]|uniref:ImmA/IrrE family metallo-endopeptidase n=1 Tax=Roseivivax sp. GX 12232 TaxID=2900547 RepID=UPI001E2FEEE3|nr:ImmA/IrrE family metallo-endopeptidase [Roseivivax sp. GX 12232]MCE0507280.1 ImmA/IrrE family metallo-endopeptidase [Roseivivax sp. GX 12232]